MPSSSKTICLAGNLHRGDKTNRGLIRPRRLKRFAKAPTICAQSLLSSSI